MNVGGPAACPEPPADPERLTLPFLPMEAPRAGQTQRRAASSLGDRQSNTQHRHGRRPATNPAVDQCLAQSRGDGEGKKGGGEEWGEGAGGREKKRRGDSERKAAWETRS